MGRDPYRYFRIEARELVDQLGQGALDLEKGTPPPDLVARLLRLAHTLKGAARVVKQPEIADGAHAIEDALAAARESTAVIPRERIDLVLKLLDDIGHRVAALTQPPDAEGGAGAGGSAGAVPALAPSEEVFRGFRPDIHEIDVLLHGVAEAYGELASLRPKLARLERARHLTDLVVDHLASPVLRDGSPAGEAPGQGKAASMAEELRAMLASLEQDLFYGMARASRELGEVRNAAERLQLAPAGALFTLLERVARDTAQTLGRRVIFEGKGGEVRVDAQVLSVVQGALVQIARNAVAHGIEPPADRSAEKGPEGRVTLIVQRFGTRVVFACTDDGRGVDLEAIRRMAARKGLLSPQMAALGTEELLRLLLNGGISTASSVTEISGRGVGLDVVREAAERLGGSVTVRTEAGRGTTIEIVAPLSLASFQGMVVEAAGITAIVPLEAVRQSLRTSPERTLRTPHGQSVSYEGGHVTLVSLAKTLAPATVPARAAGPSTAVLVQGRTGIVAFSVDRIVGTENVVLRPLPGLAPASALVAGASLDPEGVPRLVLEPDALVAAAGQFSPAAEEAAVARPSILVVDDSLTTRMLEQSILESAGYSVDLASSAEEGLEKAHACRYALFLVDVEMPGMDGFTFIERTRMDAALRDIPAILVTSRNSPEDRQRGKEAGASAYIVKSEFDQGVLLDRIRRLVA